MKTKILPLAVVLILFLTSVNMVAIGSDDKDDSIVEIAEKTEKVSFSEFSLDVKGEYLSLNVDEANTFLKEAGKPKLPVYTKTFTFPSGTIIKDVEISNSDIIIEEIDGKIQPSARAVPRMSIKNTIDVDKDENSDLEQNIQENTVFEDESVYSSSEFYPNSWFDYKIRHGLYEGEDVIFVNINCYPVRYSPERNMLQHTQHINIKVIYEESSKTATTESEYDLLIIAPNKFTIPLMPLRIHKTMMGVSTYYKTLESIYLEYGEMGRDKPEQIKYFIKDAKDDWGIKYLLLVGGLKSYFNANDRDNCNEGTTDWYFPVRYTNICYPATSNASNILEFGTISDLYYSDLYKINETTHEKEFEDWDPNGDGVFAAWWKPDVEHDGPLDLVPDVYYGRLACRNKAEVRKVVKKIIQYERPTLLSKIIGKPWMEKMITVGGNTFGYEGDELDGEYLCNLSLDYMMDAGLVDKPVRIFSSNLYTGGLVPTPKDIIKEFSKGAGFVLFQGHGAPWIWDTNWPYIEPGEQNNWSGGLPIYFMPFLFNYKRLPIVVVGGCHNAMFNVTLIKTTLDLYGNYWCFGFPARECFSWKLCAKSRGGAIAATGCTGFGLGTGINAYSLSAILECNFFQVISEFDENDDKTVGEAHSGSIIKYINEQPGLIYDDNYIITIYQLFGDPSLKIGGY